MVNIQELVERLKTAKAFDAKTASVALGYILGMEKTVLFPMNAMVLDRPGPMSDDEKQKYANDIYARAGSNGKDKVSKLAIGTFALAVAKLNDEFGFSSSVDDEKAKVYCQESLAGLMPCLYGHHLERELGNLSLDDLAKDKSFVDAFRNEITSRDFIISTDSYIQRTSNRTYRTNLVFVYQYMRNKGNPQVVADLPKQTGITEVLNAWLEHTQLPAEGDSIANVLKKIVSSTGVINTSSLKDPSAFTEQLFGIVQSVTAIFAPEQRLDTSAETTYEKVIKASLPVNAVLPTKAFGSLEEAFKPLGLHLWQDWDDQINVLKEIFGNDVRHKQTVNGRVDIFGVGTAAIMRRWKDSTNGIFKMNFNNTRDASGSGGSSGGCFRAGTMVWTRGGQKLIEELQENDDVLTRVDTGEYGICSNEKVRIPTSGTVQLFGINSSDAFFTANHVFYTTTGLRAIDPIAAQRENPWLQVGTLKIGHILFRTSDGAAYERVPVERLEGSQVECDHIYGVHLRSGLRSYHANGYLVHLNYPEITIASVAKLLQAIPSEQRLKFLGHIKELEPVFAKFGAGFVSDLLSQELSSPDLLASMRPKARDTPLLQPLWLQTRDYTLGETRATSSVWPYKLPSLQLRDGIVFLNGEYCERAKVEDQEIAWSRKTQDIWEHFICRLDDGKQKSSGSGVMWYSDEEIPTKLPGERRRVRVTSTAVVPLSVEKEDFRVVQHGPHLLMRQSAGPSQAPNNPSQTPEGATQEPRESTNKTVVRQADYTMLYDLAPFEDTATTPQPTTFLDLTWEVVGDSENIQTDRFSIPALDQIAKKKLDMRTELDSLSDLALVPFYHSEVHIDEKGNTMVFLEMDRPELLAMASDQYKADVEADLPSEKLTFKESGSDLSLPFIFSQAIFTLDYKNDRIQSGLIRKYDPKMADNYGDRYRLLGGRKQRVQPAARLQAAQSVSSSLPPGQSHRAVGGGMFDTVDSELLTVGDLFSLTIDDLEVKQAAQRMLHLAMTYYMKDDDRKNLLGQEKVPPVSDDPERPDALPTELSTLDDDLANWLKNTYANAFIAYTWSQRTKEDQQKAKAVFADKERDKLIYFWKGKGKNSLSQQPEYLKLNRIATRLALRQKVPRLTKYINDVEKFEADDEFVKAHPDMKDLIGGEKWAQKLFYHCLTTDVTAVLQSNLKIATATTDNKLNKQCSILAALSPQAKINDPTQALDIQLSIVVKALVRKAQVLTSDFIGDPQVLAGNIISTARKLIQSVIDGSAKFSPELKVQFQKDLNEIDAWAHGVSETQLANAKTERILSMVSTYITEAANISTRDAGWKMVDKMHRSWGNKITDPGQRARWLGTLGVVLTVSTTITYFFQSWRDWGQFGELNAADEARMITEALQAATGLTLAAFHAKRLWQGGNQITARAGELRRTAAAEIRQRVHNVANNAAANAHPAVANQGGPAAQLARRNSLEARGVQGLTEARQPTNLRRLSLQEKLVPPTRQTVAGWQEEKVELKTMADELKTNYSRTIQWIRGFAAVLGLAMFIHSAIAVARNAKKDAAELTLYILQLIHEFLVVLVDFISLAAAIPPWVTIALVIIGVILAVVWAIYEFFKKPEPSATEIWYNGTGSSFVNALEDAPPSLCSWSLDGSGSVSVGKESTLTITGKGRADKSKLLANCTTITFTFSVSPTKTDALFKGTDNFIEKSTGDIATGQVQISLPEALRSKANTQVLPPDSETTQSILMQVLVVGKRPKYNAKTKETTKQQYLSVGENEQISFKIKGFGAAKNAVDKEHGDQYRISIKETYDLSDDNTETLETELVVVKKSD